MLKKALKNKGFSRFRPLFRDTIGIVLGDAASAAATALRPAAYRFRIPEETRHGLSAQTPVRGLLPAVPLRGRYYHHSLEPDDPTVASQLKATAERTIALLKEGVLQLLRTVSAHQLWQFLEHVCVVADDF